MKPKAEAESRNGDRVVEDGLSYLKSKGSISVDTLYDYLKVRHPSLDKEACAEIVWRMAEEEKIELEDEPPAVKSLPEFLRFWDRNLTLYVSLVLAAVTLASIYILPSTYPFVALRWILGSVFVLFIPGFVTVEALFPKGRELDEIERLALSVGLSLAIVPLIGLVLNYTPWGIRLDPIIASLTVFTFSLAGVTVARRYRSSLEAAEMQQAFT